MDKIMIGGIDIRDYLPEKFSEEHIPKVIKLGMNVANAVHHQIPIGFWYNGKIRIALAHSIFGQDSIPHTAAPEIILPENMRTGMKMYRKRAAKAIGIDAWQVQSTDSKSRNGWKTFHLHEIDGLKLITPEEIRDTFGFKDDAIDDDIHLTKGFTTVPTFVRNWNYWFRHFIEQAPSKKDLIDINPRARILHQK